MVPAMVKMFWHGVWDRAPVDTPPMRAGSSMEPNSTATGQDEGVTIAREIKELSPSDSAGTPSCKIRSLRASPGVVGRGAAWARTHPGGVAASISNINVSASESVPES